MRRLFVGFFMMCGMALAACATQPPSPLQSPQSTNTATAAFTATATTTSLPSTSGTSAAVNTQVAATLTAQAPRSTGTAAPTATRAATVTPQPNRTAITAGEDRQPTTAPTSAKTRLISASTQIYRGTPVSVVIKTIPGAVCTLSRVRLINGAEQVTPLTNVPPRTAGADGGVAWIWQTDANEAVGAVMLEANCADAGAIRFSVEIQP